MRDYAWINASKPVTRRNTYIFRVFDVTRKNGNYTLEGKVFDFFRQEYEFNADDRRNGRILREMKGSERRATEAIT